MSGRGRGQIVVTTGANSGIGLATAVELAARGFRSVGTVRSEEKAAVVAAAAATARVSVETAILDVNDAARCREVIDELRPWGLVNNAANLEFRAVEETDDDQARAQIETLVIAPARLARLAIAHMRERGEGRIVMVTSMSVTLSMPFHGWYQAGKRALAGVSDALRMEVADSGISVIQVEPGAFRTGMTAELVGAAVPRGSRYTQRYERGLERIRSTSRYWRDPAHVAGVIADALTARSPRPRYLVGYDAMIATLLETVIPKRAGDAIKRLFYP